MKKILFIAAGLIFIMSFSKLKDDKNTFKKLYQLEGVWKMTGKKGSICEEWKVVSKNYMQSKGYYIKGKDTLMNERIALRKSKEGIFYTSTVKDQNNRRPVVFKLTSSEEKRFVFENKDHDFPKRIVYQFIGADSLHAFIDDGVQGTKQAQHFYYVKQKNKTSN